jgi:PAS domain S-box-containing protein
MNNPKLLFIEDSENDYLLMTNTLIKAGLDCTNVRVQTLDSLHEQLSKNTFDCFILDYDIPGYYIEDFLKVLKKDHDQVPIILVSGTISEEQVLTLLRFGARDYVMKSNLKRLPTTIEREVVLYHQRIQQNIDKKAIAELRKMLEIYAENIDDVISIHDFEGNFKFVSPSVAKVYGYSPEEVLQKRRDEDIHPKDKEKVLSDPSSLLKNPEKSNTIEWRRRHKNGHYIWLETKSRLVKNDDGVFDTILCSTRDITARKEIEEALAGSERRFRNLVQNSSDIVTLASDTGKILYESPTFYTLLGYEEKDIIGSNMFSYIHPDDFKFLTTAFNEKLTEKGLSNLYLYRFRHANGTYRYLESRANNLLHDPSIGAVVINTRDVTERIESEKIIRDHTEGIEKLSNASIGFLKMDANATNIYEYIAQNIFDFVPNSIIAINEFNPDSKKLILRAVLGSERVTGMVEQYAKQISIGSSFLPNEETIESLKSGKVDQVESLHELVFKSLPKSVCDIAEKSMQMKNIYSMGFVSESNLLGNAVIITFKDSPNINVPILETLFNIASVTIHRSINDEKIRQSLSEKVVMLKEIHHRVKNNLQIISSLLELQAYQIKDDATRSLFSDSQSRVKSMALIHERIYKSSDLANIDYNIYLQELVDYLFDSYGNENVSYTIDSDSITMSIDNAIPCGIIINELVSNSLKHAFPDGRKGIISISLKQNRKKVTLIVSDDGIGMAPNMDIRKSTSLGLELVNALVQQLNAKITLETNNGTTFTIVM